MVGWARQSAADSWKTACIKTEAPVYTQRYRINTCSVVVHIQGYEAFVLYMVRFLLVGPAASSAFRVRNKRSTPASLAVCKSTLILQAYPSHHKHVSVGEHELFGLVPLFLFTQAFPDNTVTHDIRFLSPQADKVTSNIPFIQDRHDIRKARPDELVLQLPVSRAQAHSIFARFGRAQEKIVRFLPVTASPPFCTPSCPPRSLVPDSSAPDSAIFDPSQALVSLNSELRHRYRGQLSDSYGSLV